MNAPESDLPEAAQDLIRTRRNGPVVWLTGAGISAESGIPTFRGEEGYWTVGSRNYQPTELATSRAFFLMPDEIWAWYLYRRALCRAANPNAAHLALANLENSLGADFRLVTQNVDGLHLRAGNSLHRTWQIHGNIEFARCAGSCDLAPWPLPPGIPVTWEKDQPLTPEISELLRCPKGCRARPHVLWFDEYYDEENFHFESSQRAAKTASLLIVVGSSGATTLPNVMARDAIQSGVPVLVIDPEPNPFSEMAEAQGGVFLQGTACTWVPALCEAIAKSG